VIRHTLVERSAETIILKKLHEKTGHASYQERLLAVAK
jgi:hypothetical protein